MVSIDYQNTIPGNNGSTLENNKIQLWLLGKKFFPFHAVWHDLILAIYKPTLQITFQRSHLTHLEAKEHCVLLQTSKYKGIIFYQLKR